MTSVSEFSDIELDAGSQSGTFKVAKGFAVEDKLKELAEKAEKMGDFSIN